MGLGVSRPTRRSMQQRRAKSNLNAHRVYSAATDRSVGAIADQTIALDGNRSRRDYPVHLRRIRFKDPETGKTLVFLTNQTMLPALTICDLYKSRWQVEFFFKWVKQHLRIKRFYGTSENAVKTQIWIAVGPCCMDRLGGVLSSITNNTAPLPRA
jgi:hypothetical protein